MFATGIECSYPTITGRNGRRKRVDELAKCFHYQRWRDDLRLVHQLGIKVYIDTGCLVGHIGDFPYSPMHLGVKTNADVNLEAL